jgi:hypothetical protein
MTALKVTGVDNRGDDKHPFGYIYFSDGSRIGWAPGARGNVTGPYGLFIPETCHAPVSGSHYVVANRHMKENYPQYAK